MKYKNIINLLPALNQKDLSIARNYIKNKDFESLQDLVDIAISDYYKGSKLKNNPYLKGDINKLLQLKSEVDFYIIETE